MRQDLEQRNYFHEYSSQSMQRKEQYSTQFNVRSRNEISDNQFKEFTKQPKYLINNLPIIYDSARSTTPKRNSRIVYAHRQQLQHNDGNSTSQYEGLKFNNTRQQFGRPHTPTKKAPDYQQYQRKESATNFNPEGLQAISIPAQSRPPGFGERTVSSYIASQIQLEPIPGPELELKGHIVPPTNQPRYPQNINNNPNRQGSTVTYGNQQHFEQNSTAQRQRVINSTQLNSKSGLSTTPRQIPPTVLNQMNYQNAHRQVSYPVPINPQNIGQRVVPGGPGLLSFETVPKIQFDKCITQCKNWQTKYNELYLKYMSLAASAMESNSAQMQGLRQQNYRLKKQLKDERDKYLYVVPMLSSKFEQMVNSQRQATIRECTLLMERYKLEVKQNKF